jgi:tight adherence protein C
MMVLLLLGGTGGLSVVAVIAAFRAPATVRLDDALDRVDERNHHGREVHSVRQGSGLRATVDRQWSALAFRLPGAIPGADLKVIGWTRERFVVTRLTASVQYAGLLGPGVAVLAAVAGSPVPLWFSAASTLGGAALGFAMTNRRIAGRAHAARQELRHATVSYLRQVALLSQSGAGVVSALTRPTTLNTSSWAFGRLHTQLELARRSGEQPWEGLRRYGLEVDVDELTDLSDIAAGAGADGAAVVSTLVERADSLTAQMQTEIRTEMNTSSGKMSTPQVAMVWIIALWVGYPVISLLF